MQDTLIIGAGPTGSHVAQQLASRGYQVLVLERKGPEGTASCCTGILGRECLERFPVEPGVILREVSSARLYAPSGVCLRLWKEAPQAYITDRAAFDAVLRRKAEEAGAHYLWGCTVTGLFPQSNGIRAEVQQNGHRTFLEAKTAVIAGGFSSPLPQQLGLGRTRDQVIGAQAEVMAPDLEEVEIYFGRKVAPGFFAWLVPTAEGKALAGLFSRRQPGLHLRNFLQSLYEKKRILSPLVSIAYGGIPLYPLARTYTERILAVGDAAGQIKPTTGGGIYYGLLSAEVAAKTIGQALESGDFSARHFSSYEKEWRGQLQREIQIDYYARKFFERLGDKQIDFIFSVIASNGIHESLLKSPDFSFDWHGDFFLRGLRHQAFRASLALFEKLLPRFLWKMIHSP